ncbi:MAG TPA: ferric iron uptake transcriptional regulator [Usitatibacteraceae bacterium]|nr:ferric iron uptake transcriptional regulator [Usitatibacteraceae bacterium]
MPDSQNLKSTGLKSTLPRRKVLDLFNSTPQRHLSAEDVYRFLLKDNSEIGLATVYRVLQQFEHAGLLIRHHFESGRAVYELNEGSHHDHIVCVNCGHVEEFTDPEIEKRQDKVARQLGFVIRDHHLVLYAEHCPHCPAKP